MKNEQKGLIFVSVIVAHLHILWDVGVCFWRWINANEEVFGVSFELKIFMLELKFLLDKCSPNRQNPFHSHIIASTSSKTTPLGSIPSTFLHTQSLPIILFIWNFYFRQLPIKATTSTHMYDFLTFKAYRDYNVTRRKRKLARMLHTRH